LESPLRKLSACLTLVALFGVTGSDTPESRPAGRFPRTHTTPLTAAEEADPAAAALARRFNPAMAIPQGGIWPVDVRYGWADGADLVGEVVGAFGRVRESHVAVPNAELERRGWGDLPTRDAEGREIRYRLDTPGDDLPQGERGETGWRTRFRALAGDDPARSEYPPTQYAHCYWIDRAQGLLGVQYWFYYPFNEWVNRHEGDWEHVNVVLKGASTLSAATLGSFAPVGYQFFFHSWRMETNDVVRVAGAAPDPAGGGDHVVVFAGGPGRMLGWGGAQSGASYPWPAVFPGAGSGPFPPDEDTRAPGRFIAADDFRVVLLPEPERLDDDAQPALSWLRLPFYAGQRSVTSNPPPVGWLGFDHAPSQPARRASWNGTGGPPVWVPNAPIVRAPLALPTGWALLSAPAHPQGEPAQGPMRAGLLPSVR
jgi:hypothetical protein